MTSCTSWKVRDENSPQNCMFLNANISKSECTKTIAMKCMKDDLSYQTFCQYIPTLSECHCTNWQLVSTTVSPDFTAIMQNYERTCKTPYDEKNRTESKTVRNTTLTLCSSWRDIKDLGSSPKCIHLSNSTVETDGCSSLHVKYCKNEHNSLQYFCQFLPTQCPKCSDWIKTSAIPTSDFKGIFERFQQYCPNGTSKNKTDYKNCEDLSCTNWELLNSTNSQCTYENNQVNNLTPGQCSRLHQRTCTSKKCNFDVSICQNIGMSCPSCQPWSWSQPQPSADFTMLNVNRTRICLTGNKNITENQMETCPMNCPTTWERYDVNKDGKCVYLPNSVQTECYALHVKKCQSTKCLYEKELSFCKYIDIKCDPTPSPAGMLNFI